MTSPYRLKFTALALFAAMAFAPVVCIGQPSDAPSSRSLVPGVLGLPSGAYRDTVLLSPDASGTDPLLEYRFDGKGRWRPFDRTVQLGAFPGEERRYTVEFKRTDGSDPVVFTYTIDRMPPPPPRFKPASGDAGAKLNMELDGGKYLYLSVDGEDFKRIDAGSVRMFESPGDSTRVIKAAAYEVDEVGNASSVVSGTWRLIPSGSTPSTPFSGASRETRIVLEPAPAGIGAELTDLTGALGVTLRIPAGTRPFVAVNPGTASDKPHPYIELSTVQNVAECVVPFPWGYEGDFQIFYGYMSEGLLRVASKPLTIKPQFPDKAAMPMQVALIEPRLEIMGGAAVIEWPVSSLETFVSIAESDFMPYRTPIVHPLSAATQSLQYYCVAPDGTKSRIAVLEVPAFIPGLPPPVIGVEHGGAYGTTVVIKPQGVDTIRYEITSDAAEPPPVSKGSPVIGIQGLVCEGRPGEVTTYRLRLLDGVVEGGMPVERFISFVIDREAPPTPQVVKPGTGYGSFDSLLSFRQNPGTLYVSISEDGYGPFKAYEGSMTVGGEDGGRRYYQVRAYAEDEFGNRSPEMQPIEILVDRSSVYVDQAGRPGASGSPEDPFQSLDEAIESAQAQGKRFIYVRGTIPMRKAARVRGSLKIQGGFDREWRESPASLPLVQVNPLPASTPYALVLEGGELTISNLALGLSGPGSSGLLKGVGGTLRLVDATLQLSGGTEMTAISSTGADVTIVRSLISLGKAMTGRGIEIQGAVLTIDGLGLSCTSSVRHLDAIRVTRSDAAISNFRLDAAPDYALSGITASGSRVSMDRSFLKVRGGTSSSRMFNGDDSRMALSSSYIDIAWKGTVDVINAGNESVVNAAHLTVLVDSPRATLMVSTNSAFSLGNTIANFTGAVSTLIKSTTIPQPGSITANCLWGFSNLLDGAESGTTMADLNAFAIPGYLNFIEEPSNTFSASVKSLWRLSQVSACVDGGAELPWIAKIDLFGAPRPSAHGSGRPDIGAEELD
jgi:hypothetical protein